MDDKQKKIQKLTDYFKDCDDVVMAFLFGSQAKGYARDTSDWDIGVYFTDKGLSNEKNVWRDIENIVGQEVDLAVLTRVASSVAWSVLRAGIPLSIKDRELYLDFMFRVSDEANAWYATSEDYYRVFERSHSLAPEDLDRLRRLLTFLEEGISEYADFKDISQQQYQNDRMFKRNIEHWIEHMVVAAVDVAEIILASEKRQMPTIYRELVLALSSVSPFNTDDTCEKISEWVQLRNLLAHEYLDYRFVQVRGFLNTTKPYWVQFVVHTKKFLRDQTGV